DGMAFIQHAFDEMRKAFSSFTEHEKTCAQIVQRKYIEDRRGVDEIGAVVERQAYQRTVEIACHVLEIFKNSRRGWLRRWRWIQNHRIHCYAFCEFGIHQCWTPRRNN